MSLKPYVLLLNTLPRGPRNMKVPLAAAQLKEVRRILGPESRPLMAWETGAAVVFVATTPAREMIASVIKAIGPAHQISALELGPDLQQFGSDGENDFFAQVLRLIPTGPTPGP